MAKKCRFAWQPLCVCLTVFSTVSAQVSMETWCRGLCSEGQICGKGMGDNENKANLNANKEIAQGIVSSISSVTINDVLSVEEKDGLLTETSQFVENTVVKSNFENMEATKLHRSYKENGIFVSERYICKAIAAKPYLRKLEHLKDSLKISVQKIDKETCHRTLEIYKQIRIEENIVENLEQMNKNLQKEYNGFYEKIKKDCGQIGRGIYTKSNSDYFEDKIGSFLANNCAIANEAAAANLLLNLDVKECEIKTDNVMNAVYCSACVKVNLLNNRTGKSAYKDDFKGAKVGWTDKENACKKASEKAVSELWEKIKGKVLNEGCK